VLPTYLWYSFSCITYDLYPRYLVECLKYAWSRFPNVIIDSRPLSICFRPICFVNFRHAVYPISSSVPEYKYENKSSYEFSPTAFIPTWRLLFPNRGRREGRRGSTGTLQSRVHKTGSTQKTGETGRKTGTFFPRVGWAGRNLGKLVFVLLPSRSGFFGIVNPAYKEFRVSDTQTISDSDTQNCG
jgi:hypothetical protein